MTVRNKTVHMATNMATKINAIVLIIFSITLISCVPTSDVTEKETIDAWASEGVDFWKILSMDFKNNELIKHAVETGKPVFVSSGVASSEDIEGLISVIDSVNIIHTSFSDDAKDANLSAIETIRKITKSDVSFGLHSQEPNVVMLATAYGPSDIFFYVRGNDVEQYPDHDLFGQSVGRRGRAVFLPGARHFQ